MSGSGPNLSGCKVPDVAATDLYFDAAQKGPPHDLPSPINGNQRANLRRAKNSKLNSPAERNSEDGSGTVEVLVKENRLVTDPSVVRVPLLPPPKATFVVTVSTDSAGENVAEPVPLVVFEGPSVNCVSSPGVENSTTLTPPLSEEPAPPVCNAQSSMVHRSQVTV